VEEGRNKDGTFAPGNKFGSKAGRRDKFNKEVRKRTNNLLDLIEDAIQDLFDDKTPKNVKHQIRMWLTEMDIGKPTQYVDKTTRTEDSLEEAMKKVEERENGGDDEKV
jgi:hypothetical protein